MKKPAYTIAIPVYQRVLGFRDSLESALAVDGCTDIMVVDDNSEHEDFREICQSVGDKRVKYFRNKINHGVFGNWNKCIELAEADYMSILCSDDLIDKDAFNLFLKVYESNPEIDIFFGSFAVFKESMADMVVNRNFREGKMRGIDLLANCINTSPGFPVLSVMRTSTMRKYPYVSHPHSGNDFLWIYSNAMSLNLYAVSRPINYWRRHAEQDAIKSQMVTMDCWPLMYTNMAEQLKGKNDYLARKAVRRAKELILSKLINGFKSDKDFQRRLLEIKGNIFIDNMRRIIDKDILLSSLLYGNGANFIPYNMGRLFRKAGYYPF